MAETAASDVVVVGGGVIGVATALELAGRGATVTVVERMAEVGAACSQGNAGIVGATHVTPLASRAAVRFGLRSMLDRAGAFSIAPRPSVLPWLARFLAATSPARERAAAATLGSLAMRSLAMHRELGERLDTGFAQRGFLSVYGSHESFDAAREQISPAVCVEVLDGEAVRSACPQIAATPAGALFTPGDAHCDPQRFVTALADEARRAGVTFRTGVEVHALRRGGGRRVASLATSAGELAVGELVLATGAWAPELIPGLPVQGGKGYHVDLAPAAGDLEIPTWFLDRRVVVTPLADRLRLTGGLQIAGTDLRVDQRRVDAIDRQARELLTGLDRRPVLEVWRGLRPCSPDGLPIVGRSPSLDNVTLATGHGMWGLQLAPVTGRIVAELLSGTQPSDDPHPLRPGRFRYGPLDRYRPAPA